MLPSRRAARLASSTRAIGLCRGVRLRAWSDGARSAARIAAELGEPARRPLDRARASRRRSGGRSVCSRLGSFERFAVAVGLAWRRAEDRSAHSRRRVPGRARPMLAEADGAVCEVGLRRRRCLSVAGGGLGDRRRSTTSAGSRRMHRVAEVPLVEPVGLVRLPAPLIRPAVDDLAMQPLHVEAVLDEPVRQVVQQRPRCSAGWPGSCRRAG